MTELLNEIPHLLTPLRRVKQVVPKLSRLADDYRGENRGQWPDWCFVPMDFSANLGLHGEDIDIVDSMCRWQLSKGVYRFDPDVSDALVSSSTEKVPVEVFDHLPEWCVFIPTPSEDSPGFWVHIQWSEKFGKSLCFILLGREGEIDGIFSLPLVSGLTLKGLIRKQIVEGLTFAHQQLVEFGFRPAPFGPDSQEGVALETERWLTLITTRLPLVTYLCSTNRDIVTDGGRSPKKLAAKKTKRGRRHFPADQTTEWQVAVRLGAGLRSARGRSSTTGHGIGRPKRPHVRRAHFHSYWTGSKTAPDGSPRLGERQVVKWIPPMLINAEQSGDLPITVRPVERAA